MKIVRALGSETLVLKLSSTGLLSAASQEIVGEIMAGKRGNARPAPASASTLPRGELPKPPASGPARPAAAATHSGWAYIGNYQDGVWRTRYFVFDEDATPAALNGQTLAVNPRTGNLNVRSDMPTPAGEIPGAFAFLRPRQQATISQVTEWQGSGFIWARVSF